MPNGARTRFLHLLSIVKRAFCFARETRLTIVNSTSFDFGMAHPHRAREYDAQSTKSSRLRKEANAVAAAPGGGTQVPSGATQVTQFGQHPPSCRLGRSGQGNPANLLLRNVSPDDHMAFANFSGDDLLALPSFWVGNPQEFIGNTTTLNHALSV